MSKSRTRPSQPADAVRPASPVGLLPRRDVAIVVAAALVLRLLTWWLFSRTPFFRHPVIDGSFFDLWAQAIVSGHGASQDVWFKPPLYAYWLALVYRVGGHAPLLAYALQIVMGIATSVLVLAIGRRVFTPRVALAGAVIAAVLPIPAFLEMQLLAESLTTLLQVGAVLALLLAAREGGSWRLRWLAVGGLMLGIAATGRPNVLLFVPLAAWWVWSATPRGAAARWRPAVVVLVMAGLALVPTTLRNAAAGQSLVPVSANFGINLWTGIAPGADGETAVQVGTHWDDLLLQSQEAGAGTPEAASRYYTRRAVHAMLAHPVRTVALVLKKAVLLIGAREIRNNIGPGFLAREYHVVTLARWWPGFWLVAPLALLGLCGARRWGVGGRLLVLYLVGLALSILPFFVNARFRAPMLPVVALFAAAGVDDLVRSRRDGGGLARARAVGLLLVFAVAVNVPWFPGNRDRDDARDHYNLAMAYSARLSGQGQGASGANWRSQDPNRARAHFERAMALDPTEADYPEGYGQLLMQQAVATGGKDVNLLQRAAQLHRRAAEEFPRSFRSWANLGLAELLLAQQSTGEAAADHLRQAVNACQRALQVAPAYQPAIDNLRVARQRLQALDQG